MSGAEVCPRCGEDMDECRCVRDAVIDVGKSKPDVLAVLKESKEAIELVREFFSRPDAADVLGQMTASQRTIKMKSELIKRLDACIKALETKTLDGKSVEELVNEMAESAHNSWWQAYRDMGYASRKSEWDEEFMVSFNQLSERGQEFDRSIMRAILHRFEDLGLKVVRR